MQLANKGINLGQFKGAYSFNNNFEKRMAYEYAVNLINSSCLRRRGRELLEYISELLGQRMIVKMLLKRHPEIVTNEDFGMYTRLGSVSEKLSVKLINVILKDHVLPYLNARLKHINKATSVDKKLSVVKRAFNLSAAELAILEFFYVRELCEAVNEHFDSSAKLGKFSKIPTLVNHGQVLLSVHKRHLQKALENRSMLLSARSEERR